MRHAMASMAQVLRTPCTLRERAPSLKPGISIKKKRMSSQDCTLYNNKSGEGCDLLTAAYEAMVAGSTEVIPMLMNCSLYYALSLCGGSDELHYYHLQVQPSSFPLVQLAVRSTEYIESFSPLSTCSSVQYLLHIKFHVPASSFVLRLGFSRVLQLRLLVSRSVIRRLYRSRHIGATSFCDTFPVTVTVTVTASSPMPQRNKAQTSTWWVVDTTNRLLSRPTGRPGSESSFPPTHTVASLALSPRLLIAKNGQVGV